MATVTISVPEAMMERAIRSLESNLPVPKNKREANSRPAMTNFSIVLCYDIKSKFLNTNVLQIPIGRYPPHAALITTMLTPSVNT